MGKVTSSWIVQNACRGKCEDFYYPASDYRALEADRDQWKDQVENPKMTYCAFCGQEYDLDDREKATELIVKHVLECEKHPYAALQAKLAALVVAANCITKKYFDEKAILHMVDFEYLKAAIAAAEGKP